jgi:TolB-like protein/Tfp pilus assembly protein PilF
MKRCPQCSREYDNSMMFCLDDGAELLYGPASLGGDEAATAIVGLPTEPQTRILPVSAQIATRETGLASHRRSLFAGLIVALIAVAGLGYWYFKIRPTSASAPISSIAVLPFQNRNSDADTEYLSDGLAESLIYRLSQIPELKVAPRSSAFRYKGQDVDAEKVGGDLGVDAVMSGRLVQHGDNLIISIDLVDVRNKKTLWGEQFERKMTDILATQREIAAAIADKLQLRLSGNDSKGITKQYTTDNEAYQLYLKGRFYWNKRTDENLKKAIELLKSATEKDPNFALAYAALADCYVVLPTYGTARSNEVMPIAKAFAEKSIQLDPTLAEPHASLGLITWFLEWDKDKAEAEFLRAIELNPNYATTHQWYQRFLRAMNRGDEAYKEINRAVEIEPLSLIFINNIAEMQVERGETDAAVETCHRMAEMDPNFWATQQTLVFAYTKQGRYQDALTAAQKGLELSGRSNAALAQLGHVYGRFSRRDEAATILKDLETKFENKQADARDIADVYSGLGDKDKAFEWLEKGFEYRSFNMAGLTLDPLLDPLKDDPRWRDMKRRIGLPE